MDEMTRWQRIVDRFLRSEGLSSGAVTAIELVALIVLGIIAIKIIVYLTRRAMMKSTLDASLYKFVLNGVKVVLYITLVTMGLSILGVSPTTIVTVVGAAGAAIALALKDSLANIAGGMMIMITKPFSKEDYIDVGDVSGKVEHIDLFLTTLRTYDYKTITIPNGLINTSILVNHSKEDIRRVDCVFGIGYDNNIGEAKTILENVCEVNEDIMKEPGPVIGVANHGDNAVMLDLKVWCRTEKYWDIKYFLEENVKIAFDEHGIDIPYPQMDVHIVK